MMLELGEHSLTFDTCSTLGCPTLSVMCFASAAGLCLFTLHASQFSTCLLDNYVSLFEVLSKWCSHPNTELKKAAHSALESFLKQVLFKNILCKKLNSHIVCEHLKMSTGSSLVLREGWPPAAGWQPVWGRAWKAADQSGPQSQGWTEEGAAVERQEGGWGSGSGSVVLRQDASLRC